MVGAGTVRAERYGAIVKTDELRDKREAEGLEPEPLAVVVSGRLDLPAGPAAARRGPTSAWWWPPGSEREVPGAGEQVTYERVGDDLPLLLARLRSEHGVRSVLCEGGPTLNSFLFAAGLVDELFLTLDPKVAGRRRGAHDRGRTGARRARGARADVARRGRRRPLHALREAYKSPG